MQSFRELNALALVDVIPIMAGARWLGTSVRLSVKNYSYDGIILRIGA